MKFIANNWKYPDKAKLVIKALLSLINEVLRGTSDIRLLTSDNFNIPSKISEEPKILYDFNKVIHRLVAQEMQWHATLAIALQSALPNEK